jgi:hypothetical protein
LFLDAFEGVLGLGEADRVIFHLWLEKKACRC